MIFITTLTEQIYNICGKQLLQSFIDTNNHLDHQLYIFFEDKNNPHTEYYPEWLVEWSDRPFFTFINLMNYEYEGKLIVDYVDNTLPSKITFDHLYNSPRSVKWFRPVASIMYANELIANGKFSSIDSDCLFVSKVKETLFSSILDNYNVAFLGRENFTTMRHGDYDSQGNYIHTRTVEATESDHHTETGYIGFNLDQEGTREFITNNFKYWIDQRILQLKFKTDCHTFDAARKELPLKYNNLCDPMGTLSPIGSRVIEDSVLGSFLVHHKGTLGPQLSANNLV
tara:strand:- start:1628 stop:2479 length:852 start_codon:yes stop_codon:yes gene_type:complete